MFRSRALTLQKAFDVAGNELALHRPALVLPEILGARDAVTACLFRDIHARVRDPNDVFCGETTHRKTGDPEAAGDVVLAQHRVSSKPSPTTRTHTTGLPH